LAANGNCKITVGFKPAASGSLSATLKITDNAAGSPQQVTLGGTGLAPVVTLLPTSLTFQGTPVGAPATAQQITVSNTGTAPLTLSASAITITGSGASSYSQTDKCGTSVPAGGNCVITIAFTPKTSGILTATVNIADNATGSPQEVALSGTGVAKPTITSLSPGTAIAGAAGFTLTVTGTNCVSGATVNWNGNALPTTYKSATQLTATVAAGLIASSGTASVTVTNVSGTSSGSTFTIYGLPAITSLSPTTAVAGGAAFTLTINGTNFVAGSTTAKWGTTPLTLTFKNATQLTAPVTAAQIVTAGSANVTVTTPGGTTAPATFTIDPKPPTIASLSPSSTAAGGPGFTLTVNGTNFVSGAKVNWGTTALATTVVSASKITALVPAGQIVTAGKVNVSVVTAGGASPIITFTITQSH
jgi:hypothetical protein